jgi:hypothetical protein
VIYSIIRLHVVDRFTIYNFFRFTFVYLLLTFFSFQQSGEAKTKITEDVNADKARISNDSGTIVNYCNSVEGE